MKLRVILVSTLLMLAAVPSVALPLCGECDYFTNHCEYVPGAFERCLVDRVNGICYTTPQACTPPGAQSTVLTDWKVASVETSRPAQECVTVTAPTAAAEVPTPAPRTTELK